ncbi:hypothetical protein SPRG_10728 [Saprolegnia parasitica CBS 223.65]|uniref:Uncharacterized protein n=1 Tax=Saprolegnia parasitica (strain CBS 223.65) TaxID=695850 RepID=A0A067BYC4_SAPPC|nr:hypothetical protein SPRG_10728 [Saprolegnia parasitica CBS 223.65]KDO23534.1 hypothetical protein SPRG_10728 [Saprolegnia parasitica CBS 223.65]|eukprot:XP_012205686.1 hypothetical protein SPRG_10728 [Saprolegnia parasitica CBS 223.65]
MSARQERNRSFLAAVERLGYAPLGSFAGAGPLEPKDVDSLMRGSLEPVWHWVALNVHAPATIELYRRNVRIARHEATNATAERQRKRDACAALKEKKAFLERTLANVRSENQKDLAALSTVEHDAHVFAETIRQRQRSQVLLHGQANVLQCNQGAHVATVANMKQRLLPRPSHMHKTTQEVVDAALDTLQHDCATQRDQIDPPVTNLVENVFQVCSGLDIVHALQQQPPASLPTAFGAQRPMPTQKVDTLTSVRALLQERQQHHIAQFVQTMKLRQATEKQYPPSALPPFPANLSPSLRAYLEADEAHVVATAVYALLVQYEQEVEAAIAAKQSHNAHIQTQVHEIQAFTNRFEATTREISIAFQRNRALVLHILDQHNQLLQAVHATILSPYLGHLAPLEQQLQALGHEERTAAVFASRPTPFVARIGDPHDALCRLAQSLDVPDYGNVHQLLRALDGETQLRLYTHLQHSLTALEAQKAAATAMAAEHQALLAQVATLHACDEAQWAPRVLQLQAQADAILTTHLPALLAAINDWFHQPAQQLIAA